MRVQRGDAGVIGRGNRTARLPCHGQQSVVMQVLPDAGQILDERDADLLQMRLRADPREHQDPRALDRPAADDHLAIGPHLAQCAVLHIGHAGRAGVGDLDLMHPRIGDQRQVRALQRGAQEGDRSRLAQPVGSVQIAKADADLIAGIAIGIIGMARLHPGLDHRAVHRMGPHLGGDMQQPPLGVPLGGLAVIILGFEEIGQDLVPIPSGIPERRPAIVIGLRAAHIDHPVERGRPAERFPARPEQLSVVGMGLRLGPIGPVIGRIPQLDDAERGRDRLAIIGAARLQQQDRGAVFREAIGQHTARRSRAANDVIIALLLRIGRVHRGAPKARAQRQHPRGNGGMADEAAAVHFCWFFHCVRSRAQAMQTWISV